VNIDMFSPTINLIPRPFNQAGVSIIVALVMLLVLALIGVSSMNTAVVELKMAGSMQQQGIALNRADELLRVAENDVDAIIADPDAFDFSVVGDGYYLDSDDIDVFTLDWDNQAPALTSVGGDNAGDSYVTEYLGAKPIPGESVKIGTDGRVIGGAVHTFRITSRSATGKSALRLVQSIYVSTSPP
jgi:Tfp pilus assembly protein PilX